MVWWCVVWWGWLDPAIRTPLSIVTLSVVTSPSFFAWLCLHPAAQSHPRSTSCSRRKASALLTTPINFDTAVPATNLKAPSGDGGEVPGGEVSGGEVRSAPPDAAR